MQTVIEIKVVSIEPCYNSKILEYQQRMALKVMQLYKESEYNKQNKQKQNVDLEHMCTYICEFALIFWVAINQYKHNIKKQLNIAAIEVYQV